MKKFNSKTEKNTIWLESNDVIVLTKLFNYDKSYTWTILLNDILKIEIILPRHFTSQSKTSDSNSVQAGDDAHVKPKQLIASETMSPSKLGNEFNAGK